jgi:hypothetical protein
MAVLRPHLALTVTEPGHAKFSVAQPALNFTLTQGARRELGAFTLFVTHEDVEQHGKECCAA